MAKYPKRHFITSEASKTHVSLLSSWHHSTISNQNCHIWCYTPLCIFFQQQSNGGHLKWLFQLFNRSSRHTFQRIHQGLRASVIILKTNEAINKSIAILTHSIPPREYWIYILKGYSRDSSKTTCYVSMLPQSNLATPSISIHSGFIKTCISIIHHGKIIQHSSLPNLARYKLHQTINTASSIQYRTTASLKESSSQCFTHTSLF
ncbi:hypothetical protein O181_080786 [Austropuccinia psidii MF-1]|uniref:Uncharacterized protein n=1 Tax=Austropuccinia psidii MF-1 TaxID=1389203 RepID=A0A9Q3FPG1_9BASI|nr:hypothetical protein [Austropuccinia psidii MF-1]